MLTLLLVVIFSAVFVLFSDEIAAVLKKWFAIYWVRVFVPLLLISWMWIWNDDFIPVALFHFYGMLHQFVGQFVAIFPKSLHGLAKGISLFLLTSIPVGCLYWRLHYTSLTKRKNQIIRDAFLFVWIFWVVMYFS